MRRCQFLTRPVGTAKPISVDLRKRLIAAAETGAFRRAVTERLGVVNSTVTKIVKHL